LPDPNRRRAAAAAFALAATPAAAHEALPGAAGLTAGLATPLAEPGLGVAALALAVLLLPDWPQRIRRGLPLHLAGLVLGLAAGRSLALSLPLEPLVLGLGIAATGLVALAGDRATPAALALLPLLGLGIGALALPDPGPADAVLATTLGALAGAHLPLLAGAGLTTALRSVLPGPAARQIMTTGTRIAAAWAAAIAGLLLAVLLRPSA
jgi:hypothetical protein